MIKMVVKEPCFWRKATPETCPGLLRHRAYKFQLPSMEVVAPSELEHGPLAAVMDRTRHPHRARNRTHSAFGEGERRDRGGRRLPTGTLPDRTLC